jgi:hypothetical protein
VNDCVLQWQNLITPCFGFTVCIPVTNKVPPIKVKVGPMSWRRVGSWCINPRLRHYLELSGQLQAPAAFPPPGKEPSANHWIRGWVGPGIGLDDMEKRKSLTLPGLELRSLCHPGRNQSLCWLRYPGSRIPPIDFHITFSMCEMFSLYDPPPPFNFLHFICRHVWALGWNYFGHH